MKRQKNEAKKKKKKETVLFTFPIKDFFFLMTWMKSKEKWNQKRERKKKE